MVTVILLGNHTATRNGLQRIHMQTNLMAKTAQTSEWCVKNLHQYFIRDSNIASINHRCALTEVNLPCAFGGAIPANLELAARLHVTPRTGMWKPSEGMANPTKLTSLGRRWFVHMPDSSGCRRIDRFTAKPCTWRIQLVDSSNSYTYRTHIQPG